MLATGAPGPRGLSRLETSVGGPRRVFGLVGRMVVAGELRFVAFRPVLRFFGAARGRGCLVRALRVSLCLGSGRVRFSACPVLSPVSPPG